MLHLVNCGKGIHKLLSWALSDYDTCLSHTCYNVVQNLSSIKLIKNAIMFAIAYLSTLIYI